MCNISELTSAQMHYHYYQTIIKDQIYVETHPKWTTVYINTTQQIIVITFTTIVGSQDKIKSS